MGLFSAANLYGMTIRESANDGSDFTNPDADYRRLFLGEDGQLHVKDSAGAVTDIGGAGGSVATDAIWDAAGDTVVGSGANTAVKRKNNDGTTVAPTVNEDSGDGYAIGSRWLDTTADKEYVCLDASVGAAVWTETTQAGGSGMVQLAQTVLGSDTANITFSSISGAYSQLLVVGTYRTDRALGTDNLRVQFNTDTGANYDYKQWDATTTNAQTGQASINAGAITGDNATASWAASNRFWLNDYARTTFYKTLRAEGYDPNPNDPSSHGGIWKSTAAITAIKLFPQVGTNFKTGTVATLYGIT